MLRWTTLASVMAVLVLAVGARAADGDEKKPGPGGRPGFGNFAEGMFKRLDADGDGKVTKDEIKKLGEKAPNGGRFNIADILDKAFDKLDADKDGKLSAEEFKKFSEMRGQGGFGGRGNIDPEKLKQLRERFQNRKPPEKP